MPHFEMTFAALAPMILLCPLGSSSSKYVSAVPVEGRQADELLEETIVFRDVLRMDSDETKHPFQVEFRTTDVTLPATHPAATLRIICESDGVNTAMLLLTDSGKPYAYVGKTGLYVIDSADQSRMLFARDVRFSLKCGLSTARANFSINNSEDDSRCYIDARRVVRHFVREEHTNKLDPITRQFLIEAGKGLRLSVHMSREAWRQSFPMRSMSVHGDKDLNWELTNIQINSGIIRSILGLGELFEGEVDVVPCGPEWKTDVLKAIPFSDRNDFARLFADPNVVATAKTLDKLCGAKWGVDPVRQASVARKLSALDDAIKLPEKARSDEVLKLLEHLYASDLYRPIIYDSEICENDSSVFFIAGRDPNRGALKTEVVLGTDLQNRLYKTLAQLACARQLDESLRGRALDVLGAIGVPDQHKSLVQIEEFLASDQNNSLRLMLASVRVRQLIATDKDVALLREVFQTAGACATTRGICLEALLLADATSGLAKECAALMRTSALDVEHRNRCATAAACSREGREILIEALKSRDIEFPPETALALLGSRVLTTDPQWPSLLIAVKEIALDRASSERLRLDAAQLAGKATDEKEFQTRLIRQALAEGNKPLILCTMVHNLAQTEETLSFLDDMTPLLKSKDPEQRLLVAVLVAARSTKPIPPEYHAAVQRFIKAIEATNDPNVVKVGKTIGERLAAQKQVIQ